MKKFPFEVELIKNWFQAAQRDLPWRKTTDPYAIWVSEIMLQQTQVSVVKEYYLRWMACFPTIAALAAAPLEEVIKMWEGLGYYSRARNLHEAALFLMNHYGGELPSSRKELAQVKGLGPYTIGAILSFAFRQRAAAVDGNTIRVLSRYYGILDDVQKSRTLKKIWEIAEEILPEDQPWLIVEGLIELGATICKRDPSCTACPLQEKCVAFNQGLQRLLPKKEKKVEITSLVRQVFILIFEGELLVKKGEEGKLMADLYEFPYADSPTFRGNCKTPRRIKSRFWHLPPWRRLSYLSKYAFAAANRTRCAGSGNRCQNHRFSAGEEFCNSLFPFPFTAKKLRSLPEVKQSFTRFRVTLYPTLWQAIEKIEVPEYEWVPWHEIKRLPFSSGHRKILKLLESIIN